MLPLLCVLLSGCGGGDSSPAAPQPSVPAPAPTPVPTPTPTPTPAVYELAYDLSRDRFFNLIGAELRSVYTQPTLSRPASYSAIDAKLQENDAGVQLTYTLASGQAALTIGGAGPLLYPQSLVTLQRADRLVYVRADGTLSLTQPGPDLGQFTTPLKYTVLVTQSQSVRNVSLDFDRVDRRYVTGTATLPRDVPTSGVSTYTSLFTSASQTATAANAFNENNAELTIDYSTNKVSGTVAATSTSSSEPTATLTITFNGQLNPATGRVSGTLTSPDGFTGRFQAGFTDRPASNSAWHLPCRALATASSARWPGSSAKA